MDEIDAYVVLGVPPDAPAEQLKAAHRRLVRRHHPDLAPPEERAAATARLRDVNVAYGLVRDRVSRAAYDRARAAADTRALDRLAVAAGRWAGRWWKRNRASVLAAAEQARTARSRATGAGRRVAVETVGRVGWLLACALGGVAGWVLSTAATRLVVGTGVWGVLAGTLGGIALGSLRGNRLRLRLAGVATGGRGMSAAALAWMVAVAGGLALDRVL